MTKKEKVIALKQYREMLEYCQRVKAPEEKPKVLVLTKKYKGRTFKVT